jgi:methylated-DNA-[protein]-cysteine S-methyltransferase
LQPINQINIASPLGILVIESRNNQIFRITLASEKTTKEVTKEVDLSCLPKCLLQAKQQLIEYFLGSRSRFDLPFLMTTDTNQRKILETLLCVPYGKTISYGELALQVRMQNGARAVGNTMAKNLIPLLIPCHRVIRKDGTIGEYSLGGTLNKKLLLELEKLSVEKRRK